VRRQKGGNKASKQARLGGLRRLRMAILAMRSLQKRVLHRSRVPAEVAPHGNAAGTLFKEEASTTHLAAAVHTHLLRSSAQAAHALNTLKLHNTQCTHTQCTKLHTRATQTSWSGIKRREAERAKRRT